MRDKRMEEEESSVARREREEEGVEEENPSLVQREEGQGATSALIKDAGECE